jgi:hypothetical protein
MAAAPSQQAFGTVLLRWDPAVLSIIVGRLMIERSDYRQDISGGKRVSVPCRQAAFYPFCHCGMVATLMFHAALRGDLRRR